MMSSTTFGPHQRNEHIVLIVLIILIVLITLLSEFLVITYSTNSNNNTDNTTYSNTCGSGKKYKNCCGK